MGLFAIWFWLTIGGVAYQVMTHHDWIRALDTSWDQGMALFFVWIVWKIQAPVHHTPQESAE